MKNMPKYSNAAKPNNNKDVIARTIVLPFNNIFKKLLNNIIENIPRKKQIVERIE